MSEVNATYATTYSIAVTDSSKANTSNLTKHLDAKHGEACKEEKDRREEEKRIQSQNSQRDIKVFELGICIGWTNESSIGKNNSDPPSLISVWSLRLWRQFLDNVMYLFSSI